MNHSVLGVQVLFLILLHSFRSIIEATENFPGLGAFDHLEWTYDGTFEQFFGFGRGNLNKNIPKTQMPGGLPGGIFKLRFDWYITVCLQAEKCWKNEYDARTENYMTRDQSQVL